MKTTVTTLKRQTARVLADLAHERTPVLLTEHGRPAAYLVDVASYERQQERLLVLEGIARGERAIAEGHLLSEGQAQARLARWLN